MGLSDTVQQFIEASRNENDDTVLASRFEAIVSDLGCKHYACVSHVDPTNPPPGSVILQNYPEDWIYQFAANHYERIDPVLSTASKQFLPWFWEDSNWLSTLKHTQKNILNAASEFGLQRGFSIPIHTADLIPASCSIAFDNDLEMASFHAIHAMSLYLYEASARINSQRVNQTNKTILSDQQKQCLELFMRGTNSWDIGEKLNVSHRTVQHSLKEAARRLGVVTPIQAALRALYLGEIRYLDVSGSPNTLAARVQL